VYASQDIEGQRSQKSFFCKYLVSFALTVALPVLEIEREEWEAFTRMCDKTDKSDK
jgi:hypothetical protein